MLDHFFPLLFPKDSESLKILDIRLREVGAKRRLNGTSKVNRHTDTQTHRQTHRRTFWLIESIRPEGQCFWNVPQHWSNQHQRHHLPWLGRISAPPRLTGLWPVGYSIISGPHLDRRGWFRQLQVVPLHRHHPPWLGICYVMSPGVLRTPSLLGINWPLASCPSLFNSDPNLIVRPYADSSELSLANFSIHMILNNILS